MFVPRAPKKPHNKFLVCLHTLGSKADSDSVPKTLHQVCCWSEMVYQLKPKIPAKTWFSLKKFFLFSSSPKSNLKPQNPNHWSKDTFLLSLKHHMQAKKLKDLYFWECTCTIYAVFLKLKSCANSVHPVRSVELWEMAFLVGQMSERVSQLGVLLIYCCWSWPVDAFVSRVEWW